MELRHLRYFVAVAEAMNVTRAARSLNLAQPALSQQMKALEGELGFALLRRSGRGIELTAAGERFRDDARMILARSQGAVLAARQVARGDVGRLAVGMAESAGFSPVVTEAIRRFIDAYAGVDLTLVEGRTEDLVKALTDRRIDLALVRPPVRIGEGWRVFSVHRERLVAVLPKDHPLATKRIVALLDLDGTTLIWPRPRASGGGVTQALHAALGARGVRLKGTMETNEFATAINMAATGLGIALVPDSLAGLRPDAVVYAALLEADALFADIVLVTNADSVSPAADNFKRFFSDGSELAENIFCAAV